MQSVCCLRCPEGEARTVKTENTFDTSSVISGGSVKENCTDYEENMVNILDISSHSSDS